MYKAQMENHIMQCFKCATYHKCVVHMGTCKCNFPPFPFRLGAKMIVTNKDML